MKTITITTDFGDQFATAQLKAVITSLGFTGTLIENHSITPFSLVEGAFEIHVLSQYAPHGSIHVGVIDPGVGSNRRGIIIQSSCGWFIGPDNGILYPAAYQQNIKSAWQINENFFGTPSNTFHGRDVFIKAAVYLSRGKTPRNLHAQPIHISSLSKIEYKKGQILHIDAYGNIKIYHPSFNPKIKKLLVKINNKSYSLPVVKTFSEVPVGSPLAYIGSSNTLEIAINLGNAEKFLSTKTGDIIHIQ
jgi:S-adenosyl-L-methionine hydrolase (adenosine-forming)